MESTTIQYREVLGGDLPSLAGHLGRSSQSGRQLQRRCRWRCRSLLNRSHGASVALMRLLGHLDVVEVGRHFEALLAQLGRQGLPLGGR